MTLSSCLADDDVTLFVVVVETMLTGDSVMFVCVIGVVVTLVTIVTLVVTFGIFVVTWLFELLVMEEVVVVVKISWTEDESSIIWEISSVVLF